MLSQVKYLFTAIVVCFTVSCSENDHSNSEVGRPYSGWQTGEIDIHHIYTGRGESNFFILPDGTSMLIDAGDYDPQEYLLTTPALPDTSRRAGEWIARYIERVNPHKKQVNYFFLSHFHDDHFGEANRSLRMTNGRDPDYILSGICETAEYIQFDKLIDSSFPNYDFPCLDTADPHLRNYRNFVEWKVKTEALKAESFIVGANDQFTLQYDTLHYPDFNIQNLVANGVLWKGQGMITDSLISDTHKNRRCSHNKNTMSCGIRLAYGPFRYYTAGDLSGDIYNEKNEKTDIEELTALLCGEVDVCKVNHHGYLDAMPNGFMRNIRAAHYIFPVWDYQHVQPSVIERITSPDYQAGKDCKLYFTYISKELRGKCVVRPWNDRINRENGHVVVKVFDGGKQYKIYILSAENERMMVRTVYGPFFSKQTTHNLA